MKYIVRQEERTEVHVTANTSMAIELYRKVKKTEAKLEKLENELAGWLQEVPKEELDLYVKITENME